MLWAFSQVKKWFHSLDSLPCPRRGIGGITGEEPVAMTKYLAIIISSLTLTLLLSIKLA